MLISKIVTNVMANLKKLSDPKLSEEEFDSTSDKIFEILSTSNILSVNENDMMSLSLLRLHCINAINYIRGIQVQGEFNRMVISKLKETGKDVTTLDDYLNKNVRPYFPDHDS